MHSVCKGIVSEEKAGWSSAQKLGSESKQAHRYYTHLTHTDTRTVHLPGEREGRVGGWGGTCCTEWVWRSGWADTRRVTHQTPSQARGVQRSHVGTEQSSKLACERGRADEKQRGAAKLSGTAASSFSVSGQAVSILSNARATVGRTQTCCVYCSTVIA